MSKDPYWDELGIAWVAIEPQIGSDAPLKSDLQSQTRTIRVMFALASIACMVGVLLGMATIWSGVTSGAWNFVTRGIAILLLAVLAGIVAGALSIVRHADDAQAVSEMISLSIKRARRWLFAIRIALLGCAVATTFGLIGVMIRIQLSNPPKMSPVIDLALLALVVVVLDLCYQRVKSRLAKFEYLQSAFAAEHVE